MHPRITELLDHLEFQRTDLERAVDSVPEALRQRRPADGGWSVAEVIEHLSIVEARIAKRISGGIAEAKLTGLAAETDASPFLPTYDSVKVLDRGSPGAAPEATIPHPDVDFAAAWDALERSTTTLRDAVLEGDGLALGSINVPHGRFGPYTLYHWIAFAGYHEARHADQIREIGAELAQA